MIIILKTINQLPPSIITPISTKESIVTDAIEFKQLTQLWQCHLETITPNLEVYVFCITAKTQVYTATTIFQEIIS